ncbi:MAG: caspase family protein [Chloroflexi bacterium]|nr:caspase family protein [Chloroflexota bacterium]
MLRKALLVGVNDYAPVGPGGPDLRGCVNDVRDMAHTLNTLGIVPPSPRTMRFLTDARATRANILNGLQWLVTGAKRGDILIFYYSGHGSQMVDLDCDEVDKKDETICPHDYATAGMIKDDDLRKLLAGLPAGVNMDVIFDSCHSGTITRLMEDGNGSEPEVTIRYVEPPLEYSYFLDAHPDVPLQGLLKPVAGQREAVEARLNHVVWAGCRDYQTSAETWMEGAYRGIFTYCLCKVLRRAGAGITRRRVDSLVSADVRRLGFSQVPQLEGLKTALDEKVFT